MTTEPTSTARYYLAIFRRRWMVITAAVLIPLVVGVVLYASTAKTYRGTADVVINRQSLSDQLNGTPDPVADASDFIDIVQTDADAARSIEVARRVLATSPGTNLTPQGFLDISDVTASPNADLLTFTADSKDQAKAVALATAYAQAYTDYSEAQTAAAFRAAANQLQGRIAAAQAAQNTILATKLKAKADDLEALASVQTANQFLVRPSTKTQVTSPKKSVDIGLFLILGLALAGGLVALLEGLDTKVRTVEEAELLLGVPCLSRLMPPPKGLENGVLALSRPRDPASEGYRTLYASLEAQMAGQDPKVFMLTSSVESEGKSVTVANLAVVAARSGRNVVVVDLDLRRPGQNVLFGSAGRGPGVTDVLRGDISVDEALLAVRLSADPGSEIGTGSLSVLRSGPVPADPGAIAASESLAALIDHLRDAFDLVLIDAPPVLRTGDALSISRVCDDIVVVARFPTVTRPMMQDLAKALFAAAAPVAGFVSTGDRTAAGRGYGHSPYEQAPPEAPILRGAAESRV